MYSYLCLTNTYTHGQFYSIIFNNSVSLNTIKFKGKNIILLSRAPRRFLNFNFKASYEYSINV